MFHTGERYVSTAGWLAPSEVPLHSDPLRKTVLPLALLGNGHGLCGAAWPASKLAALAPLAAKVIFNTILEQSLSFPSTLRAYCNVPPVPHGKACLED